MLFSRKGKLKREFDEKLVQLMRQTKDDWHNAKTVEGLSDDYDLNIEAQRKAAEAIHFFLFKEAKIRKVNIK